MITPEELLRLETVGVLRNGRRRYDPASKQRLVEACLHPGVSLAGLALQHGVNANLLRKWVAKRQRQNGDGQPEAPIAPAFVPVRAPSPSPTRSAGAIAVCATERSCAGRLTASMPNGVTLSLEGGDAQLLSAVIEANHELDHLHLRITASRGGALAWVVEHVAKLDWGDCHHVRRRRPQKAAALQPLGIK